ncbi:MAG: ACP S-malonyltransferase [Hydrogenobaculum sp.]|jgi:[acyl-carrier-protein] S-malonyltransferase|uniref:ACP S-malonyltransferase n=1 Tax=unclassified Hydrogenobaculum TaxID=2622382 RepID=UPI0001C502EB|nr:MULTISPECIES: ACP S-malonyltransferase [unclassified Hydrogenobaculum]AEF19124.1 malonyl CoA-acyl carrier protein transacylase [Hydrogenobaculum sp. 3684]AEG46413.1 malonyl CoA-acyl carrier protein transacylase [Hydrogenobaculum sp. SHO]AGG15057.1 (Acyl-carrier-protein) S-malonyltransferase [Hydrogenobaculum sp. HO]AGH93354.1 (Acyl-carrier-protein) S-malonyltransferase [Hydrogenobaculum sp. SN]
MIAYVFPGQGSQYVGMGYDFYKEFSEASNVFHSVEEALRKNITDIVFRGTEEELSKTINTQPSLLACSYAIYASLKKMGLKDPDFVAGHSLGEYTALLVAKGIDLYEAAKLTYLRGKYMQEAVPEGKGAMAAILKLPPEKVEEVCKEAKDVGVVEPANYNSKEQTVISGEKEAVEKAIEIAKSMGGKAIMLKVSVPSHCSLMKPAADAFRLKLAQTPIQNITIPLVSNVDAKAHTMAHEIRDNLHKQIYSSVKWYQSVEYMISQGVDTFVEIGPKNVLSKLISQIDSRVRVFNVDKLQDAENVLKAL